MLQQLHEALTYDSGRAQNANGDLLLCHGMESMREEILAPTRKRASWRKEQARGQSRTISVLSEGMRMRISLTPSIHICHSMFCAFRSKRPICFGWPFSVTVSIPLNSMVMGS